MRSRARPSLRASPWGGWARRGRSPGSCCTLPATRALSAPARISLSMAASPSDRMVGAAIHGAGRRFLKLSSIPTIVGALALLQQIESDVHNHVFLPSHHLASSKFHQNRADVDAIILAGFLCMAQER